MTAASNVGVDMNGARTYRQAPPQPAAVDTESYLGAIAGGMSGPLEAAWVSSLLERLAPVDQRGRRDAAIRDGVRLSWRCSVSGSAKEFASRLERYALDQWPTDEAQGGPPEHASALRFTMWDALRFNGGSPLSWRQILTIAER